MKEHAPSGKTRGERRVLSRIPGFVMTKPVSGYRHELFFVMVVYSQMLHGFVHRLPIKIQTSAATETMDVDIYRLRALDDIVEKKG